MKKLNLYGLLAALTLYTNAFSYEFDFINLTDAPFGVVWYLARCCDYDCMAKNYPNDLNCCAQGGCWGNIVLQPGDHQTVNITGQFAGYCMERIEHPKGKWTGSVCKNQGFRITDDGIHEGSNVSLHKFTINNNSGATANLDAKLFLIDKTRQGKGGVKEFQVKLGTGQTAIPSFGAPNVYKATLLRLTNPENNRISTFLSNHVMDKDLNFQVHVNPTNKEFFLTDDSGKQYVSMESLTRGAQATLEAVNKEVFEYQQNKAKK